MSGLKRLSSDRIWSVLHYLIIPSRSARKCGTAWSGSPDRKNISSSAAIKDALLLPDAIRKIAARQHLNFRGLDGWFHTTTLRRRNHQRHAAACGSSVADA